MAKTNVDLTKVLKPKYANRWVALNAEQTKVLVSDLSPKRLLESVRKMGYKNPVITYALKDYRGLTP